MATKQIVFLVTTGADGTADKTAVCSQKGGLSGPIKSVQYITDGVRPFEAGATIELSGATSKVEILKANLDGRQTFEVDGPILAGEPVRCVVNNAGKGKCGSFVVTCD